MDNERRAALDRVLAAAQAQSGTISIRECMLWLSYALHRADALSYAKESIRSKETEEIADGKRYSPQDEIEEAKDVLRDDIDGALIDLDDELSLAYELDEGGVRTPILRQRLWPTDE